MKKILINLAHPNISQSTINAALLTSINNIEGVTVNDLYGNYPDFLIDSKREQKLCEENDIIIFQHPFYWYSFPSIVREWQDMVLEYNWCYGSKGNALKGKYLIQTITAGGDDHTYQKGGYSGFTIAELTSPMKATANLCKMETLPPFTILGIHRGLSEERIKEHVNNYQRILLALRDDEVDLEKAQEEVYLNAVLNHISGEL